LAKTKTAFENNDTPLKMTDNHSDSERSQRKMIIMREAAYLFRRRGYSGTTLRVLAEQSGIQGGSIYHHFTSKQEILFQIINNTMDLILQANSLIEVLDDPVEKLKNVIKVQLEFTRKMPDEMHITDAELWFLNPSNFKIILRKRKEYQNIIKQILKEGNERNVMRVTNINLTTTAILQMLTGISYWFKQDVDLTISEIADEYVTIILWGILGRVEVKNGPD